jgi:hypothetical protein
VTAVGLRVRLAFGGGWYVVAAAGDKIDKG